MLWIDVAAIPRDAPNADDALRFLDFMLEPKVAAASSELTGYANANAAGDGAAAQGRSRATR